VNTSCFYHDKIFSPLLLFFFFELLPFQTFTSKSQKSVLFLWKNTFRLAKKLLKIIKKTEFESDIRVKYIRSNSFFLFNLILFSHSFPVNIKYNCYTEKKSCINWNSEQIKISSWIYNSSWDNQNSYLYDQNFLIIRPFWTRNFLNGCNINVKCVYLHTYVI